MDANKKKKVVIWVSLTMLLGVGGYFAYTKLIKPAIAKRKAEKAAKESGNPPVVESGSGSGSGSGSNISTLPPSPFTKADLKKFQDYVQDVKLDKVILAPYGADSKWGKASYAAYLKYYNTDYTNWLAGKPAGTSTGTPTSTTTTTPTGLNAIGKMAYPKGFSGLGYSNVYSIPSTAYGTYGGRPTKGAFIGQINAPNIIGKIINATNGVDGFVYYQMNLLTPLLDAQSRTANSEILGSATPSTTGWVRSDQMQIKNS